MYTRKPVYAGTFYPSDKTTLLREIDSYLHQTSSIEPYNNACGIIVPHAGYIYSGLVSAAAFQAIRKTNPSRIIVLAPSHRYSFDHASVIPEGIYNTPLGDTDIDNSAAQLLDQPSFHYLQNAHEAEHSIEVQIPFIQRLFPSAPVVPILIGTQSPEHCRAIADDIFNVFNRSVSKTIVIISTDLSHFHNYDEATALDKGLIDIITEFDPDSLHAALSEGKEACGHASLLTGFYLTQLMGGARCEELLYKNSGDTAGDKNRVVGYLAAVIEREES
ncbi:MAG: AmmeMemoRadiSam system protein B [Spirochaetes bacterium]|jgi:AmmeMemoRadiSam system protein B|nr:AmmeMemoRadiSam system protein B [Spirochaetota bacterium]